MSSHLWLPSFCRSWLCNFLIAFILQSLQNKLFISYIKYFVFSLVFLIILRVGLNHLLCYFWKATISTFCIWSYIPLVILNIVYLGILLISECFSILFAFSKTNLALCWVFLLSFKISLILLCYWISFLLLSSDLLCYYLWLSSPFFFLRWIFSSLIFLVFLSSLLKTIIFLRYFFTYIYSTSFETCGTSIII